jgi:hypothetical protein
MKLHTLLFAVAFCLAGTARAQQAAPPSAAPHNPPPGAPHDGAVPAGAANQVQITPEEWQELRAAHAAALKADPDLLTDNQKLSERMKAFSDKLSAAMAKADPAVAATMAKLTALQSHPSMPPGAPHPMPSSTPPPAAK